MWQLPEEQDHLKSWFINALDLDVESAVQRVDKLVVAWESQLEEDRNKVVHKTDAQGAFLYTDMNANITTQHEYVSFAQRQGESLYLAPPDQPDRTNQNKGYTLDELESTFFDKSYKQTHIDGRWIDVQNYINNTQNKLVERQVFEPLVEAFYFPAEVVANQGCEIEKAIDDVKLVSDGFKAIIDELKAVLNNNIWLSCGMLKEASSEMVRKIPRLVEFQQRLIKLKEINSNLSVK